MSIGDFVELANDDFELRIYDLSNDLEMYNGLSCDIEEYLLYEIISSYDLNCDGLCLNVEF